MRTINNAVALLTLLSCGPINAQSQPIDTSEDWIKSQINSKLLERRDALRQCVEHLRSNYEAGRVTVDKVFRFQNALVDVELEIADTRAKRIAALRRSLKTARDLEAEIDKRFTLGLRGGEPETQFAAKTQRLGLELRLLRQRANQDRSQRANAESGAIKAKLVERRDALKFHAKAMRAIHEAGRVSLDEVVRVQGALADAEIEVAGTTEEQTKAVEELVKSGRELEDSIAERSQRGLRGGEQENLLTAKAWRLALEIRALRIKPGNDESGQTNSKRDEITRKLSERHKALKLRVDIMKAVFEADRISLEKLQRGRSELTEVILEIADTKAERIVALQEQLKNARQVEANARERLRLGLRGGEQHHLLALKADRLEVEIRLLREKSKSNTPQVRPARPRAGDPEKKQARQKTIDTC